jgi:hypothetical protein
LFHNVGTEASAIAKNRLTSRVGITIGNCIGNYPSLFLQRIYSETLLKIVAATAQPAAPAAPLVPRVIAHCHLHCPLPVRSELAIGRNMQCEKGNFKVISGRRSQSSFALISGTSGRYRRREQCRPQRADADGLGGNVHTADRHPSATDAAVHGIFGGEREGHDDGED